MKADTATNKTLFDFQAATNSVGFLISDKQAGPFRLEIGWIKALH